MNKKRGEMLPIKRDGLIPVHVQHEHDVKFDALV
jgi:hypothetical protein